MKFIPIVSRIIFISVTAIVYSFYSCNTNAEIDNEKKLAEIKILGDSISKEIKQIRANTQHLANYTETLFQKKVASSKEPLLESGTGAFYNVDDGGSAIFISKVYSHDPDMQNVIGYTSSLDSLFKDVIDSLGFMVRQVGYYDQHAMFRIYPYVDLQTQLISDIDIRNYNFYSCADEQHNPEKKNVMFSKPYADPSGKGWMISSVSPVYSEGVFQGIISLGVAVDVLYSRYIKKNPDVMLVDSSGVCIVSADDIAGILNLPLRKNIKYLQNSYSDEFAGDDVNLLKSKDKNIRAAFVKIIKENETFCPLEMEEDSYMLFSYMIPELNWYVIKFEKTDEAQ